MLVAGPPLPCWGALPHNPAGSKTQSHRSHSIKAFESSRDNRKLNLRSVSESVMSSNFVALSKSGLARDEMSGWVDRLKALLHQCVCVSWLELLCFCWWCCWWQYRLCCFLVHRLSPTPRLLGLPAAMANGANHWQCFSNLSNLQSAGL